ncbi:hypothetical protein V6N12_058333 [Hibiscus sabdariffa]|uniref:RNase H type-1 domain-containing protein n=1 Tax=Hibiscus sabdariffa TaxID=183260 RepID=A0ABR2ERU0_9ROSI
MSSIEDFIRNPKSWGVPRMEKRVGPRDEWFAPTVGSIKFKTDGAVIGGFGPAGIIVVLRYHFKEVLLKFPKVNGVVDLVSTELVAIKEALLSFLMAGMSSSFSL